MAQPILLGHGCIPSWANPFLIRTYMGSSVTLQRWAWLMAMGHKARCPLSWGQLGVMPCDLKSFSYRSVPPSAVHVSHLIGLIFVGPHVSTLVPNFLCFNAKLSCIVTAQDSRSLILIPHISHLYNQREIIFLHAHQMKLTHWGVLSILKLS